MTSVAVSGGAEDARHRATGLDPLQPVPAIVVLDCPRRPQRSADGRMNAHWGVVSAIMAFAVDQVSKALALSFPAVETGIPVLPVFDLVLVRNHGVSFGLLGGLAPWWSLALLNLAIVAGLVSWLWRSRNALVDVALGLLIGGALGNVLDRFRHGAVTDFLDFHVAGHHWPAFNLADVAVVCGSALLVLDCLSDVKAAADEA